MRKPFYQSLSKWLILLEWNVLIQILVSWYKKWYNQQNRNNTETDSNYPHGYLGCGFQFSSRLPPVMMPGTDNIILMFVFSTNTVDYLVQWLMQLNIIRISWAQTQFAKILSIQFIKLDEAFRKQTRLSTFIYQPHEIRFNYFVIIPIVFKPNSGISSYILIIQYSTCNMVFHLVSLPIY